MVVEAVAILGLSADPPHVGHLEASRFLRQMGYPQVWWMITPQNPDKPTARAPFAHRMALAKLLADGEENWITVSDIEAHLVVPDPQECTFVLLSHLRTAYPGTPFTFVMGADNWADAQGGLHTWGRYTDFLELASLLVFPREPWTPELLTCPAATTLRPHHDTATHGPVAPGHWRIAHGFVPHAAASRIIRPALAAGEPPLYLTELQMDYIRQNGLYIPSPAL